MNPEEPKEKKAVTIKEITGSAIETIPAGTEFTVTYIHEGWSCSYGLGVTQVWNDEYKLIEEIK